MSDLVYSLALEDDYYLMVVFDRPVWFRPSNKGLRFIPNDHDEVQDALIIFGYENLDFSKEIKNQISKMMEACHKEKGPNALLEPWVNHKLLMLDAKKELKNLEFKGNFLFVNHEGSPDDVDFGCKISGCLAECQN